MVTADMPFLSYNLSLEQALQNAGRFLQEAGAQSVKLEGGVRVAETVHRITEAGIPVMGHVGLTPQSVNQLGGYRVQGKGEAEAEAVLQDALALQQAGAFSVVLELVPDEVARAITERLTIPTVGIGAGPHCDGQVQVIHDMLGYNTGYIPKHAKRYADLGEDHTRRRGAVCRRRPGGRVPPRRELARHAGLRHHCRGPRGAAGRRAATGRSAHHGCPARRPPGAGAARQGRVQDRRGHHLRQPNTVRGCPKILKPTPAPYARRPAVSCGARAWTSSSSPSDAEMYPEGFGTWVEPGAIAARLEGEHRAGHFRGVCTVVLKLFNILGADRSYFGQKDAQQALVIRKMAADLGLPVEVVTVTTVRERDGVAMSSRNGNLSREERKAARVLSRALTVALEMAAEGERDAAAIRDAMRECIAGEALANVDYVSIADAESLVELDTLEGAALASLAVRFGQTRLIDNVTLLG